MIFNFNDRAVGDNYLSQTIAGLPSSMNDEQKRWEINESV
jgi:hypothetical protein